jgi:hypothetical protein
MSDETKTAIHRCMKAGAELPAPLREVLDLRLDDCGPSAKAEDPVRVSVNTLRAAGEYWLADQVCAWANARDRGQVRSAKAEAQPDEQPTPALAVEPLSADELRAIIHRTYTTEQLAREVAAAQCAKIRPVTLPTVEELAKAMAMAVLSSYGVDVNDLPADEQWWVDWELQAIAVIDHLGAQQAEGYDRSDRSALLGAQVEHLRTELAEARDNHARVCEDRSVQVERLTRERDASRRQAEENAAKVATALADLEIAESRRIKVIHEGALAARELARVRELAARSGLAGDWVNISNDGIELTRLLGLRHKTCDRHLDQSAGKPDPSAQKPLPVPREDVWVSSTNGTWSLDTVVESDCLPERFTTEYHGVLTRDSRSILWEYFDQRSTKNPNVYDPTKPPRSLALFPQDRHIPTDLQVEQVEPDGEKGGV